MYNVFITHPWQENDGYSELIGWINNSEIAGSINITSDFDKSKLPEGADLRAALVEQIEASDCVVIIEKMFENYGGWMMHEFMTAKQAGKRIILVKTIANTVKKRATVPMSVEGGADVTIIWHELTFIRTLGQGV